MLGPEQGTHTRSLLVLPPASLGVAPQVKGTLEVTISTSLIMKMQKFYTYLVLMVCLLTTPYFLFYDVFRSSLRDQRTQTRSERYPQQLRLSYGYQEEDSYRSTRVQFS
jgi:hypothetical protein